MPEIDGIVNGVFVGFGFGAIQGGLFLAEAHRSGNFKRLVVAEVVPEIVAALRRANGCYRVNVATAAGLETREITGVEVFNPNVAADRDALVSAVAEATELCTALPSVEFYAPVAQILADGLARKTCPAVLYAAENNTHAAEILTAAIRFAPDTFQVLDTVIGKMSGVVTGPSELTPITPELPRAFLVEAFNRILIDRVTLKDFHRGITVFEEKSDLAPFAEAKLYGHNAVHALLGYLANQRGYRFMSEVARDTELMAFGRAAFLEESGRALLARHGGVDPLFTPHGYEQFADDLLARMVNPWLRDAIERVIRDPRRKLAWHDRLIGTMRLALDAGVMPFRFARGAAAALALLGTEQSPESLWPEPDEPPGRKQQLKELILQARNV